MHLVLVLWELVLGGYVKFMYYRCLTVQGKMTVIPKEMSHNFL